MSFASRKLYPTTINLGPNPCNSCCCVECPCYVQGLISSGNISQNSGYCFCPNLTLPNDTCEDNTCRLCTVVYPPCNGPWWTCSQDGVLVCTNDEIPCICVDGDDTVPPITRTFKCVEPAPINPCCPNPVCIESPSEYGIEGGRVPLLDNCTIGGIGSYGAHPYTYKLESPGITNFTCGIQNQANYLNFRLINPSPGLTGFVGDSDFARNPNFMRYYRVPSEETPISNTRRIDFSRYCLKLHETASQAAGSSNRVMVISGRNVYRYVGVLSGDPSILYADPFWDDPGASGLSQIEGSLGRPFPLPDSVLQLPLWGETGGIGTDNLGVAFGTVGECLDPYITCEDRCVTSSANIDQCEVCIGWKDEIGCPCVQHKPFSATGHYLPNDQGYTSGYYSFSCFNPFSYLDSINPSNGNYIPAGGIAGGVFNAIGFGSVEDMGGAGSTPINLAFGCTCGPNSEAINCSGFAGATSHGPRLGVPTCSLYALVMALYNRIFKTYRTMSSLINLPVNSASLITEEQFRTGGSELGSWYGFPNFAAAVDACLAANPSGTTNNTSNVQYHLAKISEALLKDSTENYSPFAIGYPIRFTFPNVFLWDRANFVSASATNKWKHLYVIGNANIVFDSFSASITGPCYSTPTDYQDYRSFVFTLDEVTHRKNSTVTDRTEQARLLVFNGSDGPTQGGTPSDANPASRKNASSRISLTELPVCFGLTTDSSVQYRSTDPVISLCEICNAWPNTVCLTGSSCSPVTELSDEERNRCFYPGGIVDSPNCMTANYEVPNPNDGDGFNFGYSTYVQPYSIYVDPSIMLGFINDPWVVNESDSDDPTGLLRQQYVDRLSAVSTPYKYMQQDVGSKVNPPPGADRTEGFTGFKEFYARLSSDQKKTVMIEQEFPWLSILSATSGQAIDNNSVDWFTNTKYQRLLSDEFERQRALGVSYLDGGLTPQSPGTTLSTLKSVTKRLWGDCAQYAKDNGSENVIFFNTQGASIAATQVGGIVPWEGIRYNNTTDGRSWWRGTSSVLSYEDRYAQGMPGGSRDNFLDLAEANASGDANVVQIYNFFPNMGGPTAVNAWNSVIQRLDDNGMGGSAAQSYDFDLDDLNYWTKMTIGSTFYRYRDVLNTLSQTYATVDPNKPVALITQPASPPLKDGGGGDDAGWISNNRWSFMKDPQLYAEYEIGGSFLFEGDGNVPNVSYPDQIWMWTAGPYYNVTLPMLRGTGSSADEMEILAARCQLEKLLFKRPEMQTVAEGGLSSEAELVSDSPITNNTALTERRRSWLRANTLPNVYWDARTFIDANGNGVFDSGDTWYSEGITNNVRYWSSLTGNCLPSPCVFDRTSPLAPWLNFNRDIHKNDVRVAYKHWVSDRHVSAVEATYDYLNRLGIPPVIPTTEVTPPGGNIAV